MEEVKLLKKTVEEQPTGQSLEQLPKTNITNKEMIEEIPKIYMTNTAMFDDAVKEVFKLLVSDKNKVLDLGSDKPPKFALYLANKYREAEITHFKDTKTMERIDAHYRYENLNYVFTKRKLEKSSFDVATAFFTLHEFSTQWRKPELKILHKCLKQNGKIVVIDYDLKWVREEKINEENFTKEIFTEINERKVMQTEWDCMRTHTALGLEDYIEELANVGFEKKYSEKYHIQTSWGIRPKIFLYVGEKI